MDYIENFANKNNIHYELYDSAKYAVQNRIEEKLKQFDSDFIKQEIAKYTSNL